MTEIQNQQIQIKESQHRKEQNLDAVLQEEFGITEPEARNITQQLDKLKQNLSPHFQNNPATAQEILKTLSSSVTPVETLLGEAGSNIVFIEMARGNNLTEIKAILEQHPGLNIGSLTPTQQMKLDSDIQTIISDSRKSIALAMDMDPSHNLENDLNLSESVDEVLVELSKSVPKLNSALSSSQSASIATIISRSDQISGYLTQSQGATVAGSSSIDQIEVLSEGVAPKSSTLSVFSEETPPPPPRNATNPYLEPSAAAHLAILFADLVDISIEMGKNQHEYMITLMSHIQDNAEVRGRMNELLRELEKQEATADLIAATLSLAGSVAQMGLIYGPKLMDMYRNSGVTDTAVGGGRVEQPQQSRVNNQPNDSLTSSRTNDPEQEIEAGANSAAPVSEEDIELELDPAFEDNDVEPAAQEVTIAPAAQETAKAEEVGQTGGAGGGAAGAATEGTESDTITVEPVATEAAENNTNVSITPTGKEEAEIPEGAGEEAGVQEANNQQVASSSSSDDEVKNETKSEADIDNENAQRKARAEEHRMHTGRLVSELLTNLGNVIRSSMKIGIAEERKNIETPKALADALAEVFNLQLQNANADVNETQARVKELIDTIKKLSEDHKRLSEQILSMRG